MDAPDIIYVVRRGNDNLSLKYSLRSLAHLPHRRVFIAGHCPDWVRNVTAIPVKSRVNKFDNIEENLKAALRHEELGERAVYFNDDFYITEPIDEVPIMNGGLARHVVLRQELRIRFMETLRVLHGCDELLTYDGTHVPLPIDVDTAREHVMNMPKGLLWRTWYGNTARLGGVTIEDVKSRDGSIIPGPFLSSSRKALSTLRTYLEDKLPKQSAYG